MKTETPRNSDGNKVCAWCGDPIRQSGVGRSRDYCSRTHREYAYRARREAELRIVAYSRGRADERSVSSTVERRSDPVASVDETRPAGPPPVSAPAVPVVESVLPTAWRAPSIPLGPSRSKRRRLLPPPPGAVRGEALPLFEADQPQADE